METAMQKNVGDSERWVRLAIGSGLILAGLARKGWQRELAITLGIALARTGVTQKCVWNKALGVNNYDKEHEMESHPALGATA
jgi:uncharacterized membrane protein